MNSKLIARLIGVLVVASAVLFPTGAAQPARAQEPPQAEIAAAAPTAETGILSIPAAAFVPAQMDSDYENHGRHILHKDDTHRTFRASVQLPHGATVTRVSACFYGPTDGLGPRLYLYHYSNNSSPTVMAEVATSASDGDGYRIHSDATIIDPVVYTFYRFYAIELSLPGEVSGALWGCGATIEYIQPAAASHYYPIAAAGFRPMQDGYNPGANSSRTTRCHFSRPGVSDANGDYLAPVNLPQGAVVNSLVLVYTDQRADKNITASLQRAPADEPVTYENMASVTGTGTGEGLSAENPAITFATIDNIAYTYWIYVDLPKWIGLDEVCLHGVEIIYTPPAAPSGSISLSNANFIGFHDGFDFENHARWMFHLHGEGGSSARGVYLAPVYLPDRTKITKLCVTFYDDSNTVNGAAYLARTRLGSGTNEIIAPLHGLGSGGYMTPCYTDSHLGVNSLINNSQYAYYVYWDLPVSTAPGPNAGDVVGVSMRVDYVDVEQIFLPLTIR